ncbi:sensor histidine kinase [Magnetospirillum sp. ME-1]|uniref:sensor histidine kinase n=1 Tax=Magnetospirillum sp. ME-1 TaxID=1639348 RepID=UPI0011AEB46C|nr:HAMP domain-containing sensor histidine kinase [Magnetospirillum sp. ME-1]
MALFSFLWSSDFLPHGLCLSWRTELIALTVISEIVIGACYVSVACSLAYFARKRPDFPYPGVMTLFAIVFALCGVSHLIEVLTLWIPLYGAQAIFNAAVALLAIPAAWKMWTLVPQALTLPSPSHLQHINNELAREIANHRETENSLRQAMEAAESASRARSEFLSNMSHELRTPLNAVIGFADALLHEFFGSLNEKQRDYVISIHSSGKHLLHLINDVLDISKIDAGKLELHDDIVTIHDLVDECNALVSGLAEEAGITLESRLQPGLPNLRADALRLKQVLVNLLSNAVKFTPRGGHITLQCALNETGELVLQVRDTGIGMNSEEMNKAFEMFTQIANPMSRRAGGTGIGLPLSRSLVLLHGGRIDLNSAPGEGTRVTVYLPRLRLIPS